MKRLLTVIMIIGLISMIGCSNSLKYNDDEIAAVVRGEEITIGDLRLLYDDDKVLEMIDGEVKATLVVQEARKMDYDVEDEIEQIKMQFRGYTHQKTINHLGQNLRVISFRNNRKSSK